MAKSDQTATQVLRGFRTVAEALLGEVHAASANEGEADLHRAIHRVRRGLKRFRAVLKAAPRPRGGGVLALEDDAVEIARSLSELRDERVLEEVSAKLRTQDPKRWSGLLPDSPADGSSEAGQRSRRGAKALATARSKLVRMGSESSLLAGVSFGPADLRDALRRSFKKARRGWKAAGGATGHGEVHAWRKASIRLHHQLVVFGPLLTRAGGRAAAKLKRIHADLGRSCDLHLLLASLPKKEGRRGRGHPARELERVLRLERLKCVSRAVREGRPFYARRAKDFLAECLGGAA